MEENFVGGINAKVRESLSKFGKRTSATGSQISFTVQQGKKPNQNSSDYQSHHGAMKNNLKEAALRFSVYSRVGDEIVSSFPKKEDYLSDDKLKQPQFRADESWIYFLYFWTATLLAIAEPLICGLTHPQDLDPPKSMPTLFLVQLGILSLSTLLHIFGNAMEFIFVFNLFNAWNSISPHQLEECRYKYTQIINDIKERTTWGKLSLVYDACETLEVVCLIWGWSWIFIQPGVAVLRCFRIFRIIYYFDIDRESALHVSSKNLINYIDKSVVYWFPIWSLHTNRLEDTFSTFDSAKDADQEWFYDMVTFSQRSKFRVVSDGELNSELIIIRQMVAYSFGMKYDLTTNDYINIAEATSASDPVIRDEIDATVQQYYNKLLTYEKVKFSLYLEKFASREQVVKWEVLKRKKKNKEISEAQYNSDLSLLIEHLNVEAKAKFNLHKTGDVETINLFNMYTRQLLIGNAIEKEKAKAHIEADNFINSKAVYKLLGRKQRKKFKHLKGSIKRSLEKEIIISLNSKTKVDYTAAYTAQEQLEAFSEEVTARIGHKDEMENIIVQSAQAYDRKMRDLYISKPSDQFITLHHICHIAMTYFRQLYLEFFTRQSRGGLVIIFLFFYLTYVLAVLFHYEAYGMQDGHGAPCGSLGLCYVRLMRLLFYDGDGFDMLEQVMVEGRPWLVALLVIYMLLGAIILLNGLIGIFGRSFSTEGDGDDVNTNYLTTRQLERECMTTLSELKATQAEMMMMIKEMRPQAAVKVSNGINTAAVDLI